MEQHRVVEYQASGEDLALIDPAASRERNPLLYEEHDGSLTQSGRNQFAQAKQMLQRDSSAYLVQQPRKLGESYDGRSYPMLGGMQPTSTTSFADLSHKKIG